MRQSTHRVGGMDVEQRVFDSVEEMIDHAMEDSDKGESQRRRLFSGQGLEAQLKRLSFIGRKFGSEDEAVNAARNRWEEGLSTINELVEEVKDATLPTPKCNKRKTRFSEDDGAELDYDRLRSGQEFWRTTRRERVAAPSNLTISVDVSANAGIKSDVIYWRGVTAIVIAELLEQAGYRVELWMHKGSKESYTDESGFLGMVRLKSFGDALDRSTLVNAVSGWFYRTMVFCEVTRSHEGRFATDGLGYPRTPRPSELLDVTGDQDTLIISEIWDRENSIRYIRETLRKFAE